MQVQIQALLAAAGGTTERSNTVSNIEIAKLLVFSGEAKKVEELIMVCKLCKRTKNSKAWFQKLRFCNTNSYIQSLISKIWRFLHLLWYSFYSALTTLCTLLIIIIYLWLTLDKYLLCLNTILDVSIKSAWLLEPYHSWLGQHCSARLEYILEYLT